MVVNDDRFNIVLNVSDYKKNMVPTIVNLEHEDYANCYYHSVNWSLAECNTEACVQLIDC